MGGSFDPFHLAHLNSLLTVKESFNLDQIILIPSFKTPLKHESQEINPFHRLKMLQKLAQNYPFLLVDDQEINRKGVSYSYKTITELLKERKEEELFFIMGLDQFSIFDKWKNYEKILQKLHLIVTSRPGSSFPKKTSDLPEGLKSIVKVKKSEPMILRPLKKSKKKTQTEKLIYFCELKDMDISSSDIKKNLLKGKEFSHLLPKELSLYIKENKLYTKQEQAPDHSKSLMGFAVKELKKKKAYDIKLYDLKERPLPFSFAVIAIASNTRQTVALANHLKKTIKDKFDLKPWSEEGKSLGKWIVLDFGDTVFHIFYDYTRKFYNLEELWETSLIDS